MASMRGDFQFDKDTLRDIALGISAGFQSYDPNNPFAGAGAALGATVGSSMLRDERARTRRERLEDFAMSEKSQIERERRGEGYQIAREDRAEKAARRAQSEGLDFEVERFNRLSEAERKQKRIDEDEAEKRRGNFMAIASGVRRNQEDQDGEFYRGERYLRALFAELSKDFASMGPAPASARSVLRNYVESDTTNYVEMPR